MLTDIFADRYEDRPIWQQVAERERRFLGQMAKLITNQLYVFWIDGSVNKSAETSLQTVHDKLSMELGLKELGAKYFIYGNAGHVGTNTVDKILTNFLTIPFLETMDPDVFMKQRVSLVELAFRQRLNDLEADQRTLPIRLERSKNLHQLANALGVDPTGLEKRIAQDTETYQENVQELNARLQQARFGMNYHNGFLQFSEDVLVARQIERPFWNLVSDPIWSNVDLDMKEAVDRRDTHGRDAAFYAVRSLESAIKIISDIKGWTSGKENGPANYIDNLGKKTNAFLDMWEADALKALFSKVRNPLGHGPGAAPMPTLTPSRQIGLLRRA